MIYSYISSEIIIADFLSKTKLTDSTYADDLLEWLKEGINLLRLRHMTTPSHCYIPISSNIGKLPCGLIYLDGIVYNGKRLRKGTSGIDTRVTDLLIKEPTKVQTYFATDTTDPAYQNIQDYKLVRGDDLKPVTEINQTEYYITFPNHIQTSFKEGCVLVLYRSLPVDKEGYPLIPDEGNIKQALFWWLMAQITLSGYRHADPKMDYDYCEAKFTHYSIEGKGNMKYLSVDQRESLLRLTTNLIPPRGYYEKFFINGEEPKYVKS